MLQQEQQLQKMAEDTSDNGVILKFEELVDEAHEYFADETRRMRHLDEMQSLYSYIITNFDADSIHPGILEVFQSYAELAKGKVDDTCARLISVRNRIETANKAHEERVYYLGQIEEKLEKVLISSAKASKNGVADGDIWSAKVKLNPPSVDVYNPTSVFPQYKRVTQKLKMIWDKADKKAETLRAFRDLAMQIEKIGEKYELIVELIIKHKEAAPNKIDVMLKDFKEAFPQVGFGHKVDVDIDKKGILEEARTSHKTDFGGAAVVSRESIVVSPRPAAGVSV